jgi:hypothetical protein
LDHIRWTAHLGHHASCTQSNLAMAFVTRDQILALAEVEHALAANHYSVLAAAIALFNNQLVQIASVSFVPSLSNTPPVMLLSLVGFDKTVLATSISPVSPASTEDRWVSRGRTEFTSLLHRLDKECGAPLTVASLAGVCHRLSTGWTWRTHLAELKAVLEQNAAVVAQHLYDREAIQAVALCVGTEDSLLESGMSGQGGKKRKAEESAVTDIGESEPPAGRLWVTRSRKHLLAYKKVIKAIYCLRFRGSAYPIVLSSLGAEVISQFGHTIK